MKSSGLYALEVYAKVLKAKIASFPRKWESNPLSAFWISACAGMTTGTRAALFLWILLFPSIVTPQEGKETVFLKEGFDTLDNWRPFYFPYSIIIDCLFSIYCYPSGWKGIPFYERRF